MAGPEQYPWNITTSSDHVELDSAGGAETIFTVSNDGPTDQRLIVEIVPGADVDRAWFRIAEPDLLVSHGSSASTTVRLTVPLESSAGSRAFAGRVYPSDTAPEETSVLSRQVMFDIKAAAPKHKVPWWVFAAGAAVLVAAVSVSLIAFTRADTARVPGVIGLPEQAAISTVQAAGLSPDVTSSQVPTSIGIVIGQNPTDGAELTSQAAVTLTVGVLRQVPVPTVVDLTPDQANELIQSSGLIPGIPTYRMTTLPTQIGRVIEQSPMADQRIAVGSEIAMVVGEPEVPRLYLLRVDEARQQLAARRLQINIDGCQSDLPQPGEFGQPFFLQCVVVAQTPPDGVAAPIDSKVNVTTRLQYKR